MAGPEVSSKVAAPPLVAEDLAHNAQGVQLDHPALGEPNVRGNAALQLAKRSITAHWEKSPAAGAFDVADAPSTFSYTDFLREDRNGKIVLASAQTKIANEVRARYRNDTSSTHISVHFEDPVMIGGRDPAFPAPEDRKWQFLVGKHFIWLHAEADVVAGDKFNVTMTIRAMGPNFPLHVIRIPFFVPMKEAPLGHPDQLKA